MQKKISLVVGGTRGIGSEIAQTLRVRGDIVYTASRRDAKDEQHIKLALPNKINLSADFKLNYLIFTHRYRGGDWQEDFEVTVNGVQTIIEQLKDFFLEEAAIVILGSNASKFVLQEQSSTYHATRSALEGLTRFYATTLGPRGIRCNSVLPATIIKPENKDFFISTNSVRQLIEKITPLGRMGTAQDVADVVDFLCSHKSSFITGQSIFVDGGMSVVGQEWIGRQLLTGNMPNEI